MYFSLFLQIICLFSYALHGEAAEMDTTHTEIPSVTLHRMSEYPKFEIKLKSKDYRRILFPNAQLTRLFMN